MSTFTRSPLGHNARGRSRPAEPSADQPLVCFSHLRWGFVWQRPQHILTRLARVHPVYLVEEPIVDVDAGAPTLEVNEDHGVTILTPILPAGRDNGAGFNAGNNVVIRELLSQYFAEELEAPEVIGWYDTPMAFGALPATVKERVVVYDVIEELANHRHAPETLHEQERILMQAANLVFSSGPSLHESRKYRHARAFCFPSGVDEAHFRYAGGPAPEDIAQFPSPIIGYYGVLDARIDFDLVAGIADARPDWTVAMIGPIANIEESDLARRPNIHYLGKRSYDELPRYLARFDAAIMPYAENDATQFVSPTKTLEYLAGGKPVVSTPVRDVVDLYGDVVEIATTPAAFIDAIERQWNETPVEKSFRQHLVTTVVAEHGWDVIVSRMQRLVHDVLLGRPTFAMVLQETLYRPTPAAPLAVPGATS